jgi:folate-binding protein YgfZ
MNPNWRSFLASAKAVFAGESNELLHFGDAAAELDAASQQTVLIPLTHLAVLEATGDDAKPFLHSQFTSDINHLAENQLQHAGWCTAKGRMQASFLVWRKATDYRMTISADLIDASQKRLQMFVLRSKVKLANKTDELILLGLSGPQVADALAAVGLSMPENAMSGVSTAELSVLRLDATRVIVAAPESAKSDLWQKLSSIARPAGLPVWRWLDIQAGLPVITLATKEEFVPQMADFEKIGGVSFHKGCYPGQEIVARTQYLGKVKRHLFRVSSEVAPNAGDDLFSPDNPDQACGKIVSAAPSPTGGYAALAVIQSNFAGNVELGARGGPKIVATAVNP